MADASISLMGFVGFWCAVAFALSFSGGWWRLARQYRSRQATDGNRYWFQSASVGRAAYSGVLMFTVNPAGMRVSLFLPFRPAHPPIFVPWEDVDAKQVRRWWWNHVELRFSRVQDVPFRITLVLAHNMQVVSEGHFMYERAI